MKTQKMNRMTLGWLGGAVLTLGLMAAASWADDPAPMDPPEPDVPGMAIAGVSQEYAPTLDGAYVGSAVLTVNGVPLPVTIASSPLTLAELPDNFGRIVGTSAHYLDFGGGNTITTEDEVRFSPTQPGWYLVTATWKITQGTGMFANAGGEIGVYGEIHVDEAGVTAMSYLDGRILV
jgi:hypothetical protein